MSGSPTLPVGFPEKVFIAKAIAAHPGAPTWENLAHALANIEPETQIAGASLLTLTAIDPDFVLQGSGVFTPDPDGLLPAVEIEYPQDSSLFWRLVMVKGNSDRTQANFTITFQDSIVALMRDNWGPKSAPSGITTRAQFIKALVDEANRNRPAGTRKIDFVCPSLNVLQPVASSTATSLGQAAISTAIDQTVATTKKNKQKGVGPGSAITIKGRTPTNQQYVDISTAASIASQLKSPSLAVLAMFCAAIAESGFDRNAVNGSHVGIWQSDAIAGDQVAQMAAAFLQGGPSFQGGGAITLSRTVSDPGQIATQVEAGGQPASFYSKWLPEATAMAAAAGLSSGNLEAVPQASDVSQLQRGTPENPDEDSWDCGIRLAQQVGWYLFSNGDTLYYMDGDDLIGQMPSLYLDRVQDRADIASYEYTFDNTAFLYRSTHKVKNKIQRRSRISKPSTPSQVNLTLVCPFDAHRAGEVVVLHNWGPANGRWVITDVTRNVLSDTFSTLLLEPPLAPYPEPQPTSTGAAPNPDATTASVPAPVIVAGKPGSYGALVGPGANFEGLDQGIDFTGNGVTADVYALADGVITRVLNALSGWPGGGLLVYQLTGGPQKGRYVYVAENIRSNLAVGARVVAGQTIGTFNTSFPGLETGFAQNAQGQPYGSPTAGHSGNPPDPQAVAFQQFVLSP